MYPILICATQVALSSYRIVGVIPTLPIPHELWICCINYLNHTHSCVASYKATISEWFLEVVTIAYLIDLYEIEVPA